MGEGVYKPFMQDYIMMQASSLTRTVGTQLIKSPGLLVGMTKFMQSPKAGAFFKICQKLVPSLKFAKSYTGILWYDMDLLTHCPDGFCNFDLNCCGDGIGCWKHLSLAVLTTSSSNEIKQCHHVVMQHRRE